MSFGYSVSDIISIGELCWTVYRACRDAAGHYEEVTTELKSLHINLKTLADEAENPKSLLSRRGAALRDEFNHIIGSVRHLLKDLEQMVGKYRSLVTMEKRTWDRLRFGLKDLKIIRQKLTYHTAQMELFLSSLTVGALGRIETLLEDFISEVRSGRRTPTILSIEQGGEEAELGWKQLESDLSENGVSYKDIDRHREEIEEYLALLTIDPENQSHNTIVLPNLTSDGSLLNGQAEENNWDSISLRITSNKNDEEQNKISQLHSASFPKVSVQDNLPSQISTVPLKAIEKHGNAVPKTKEATPNSLLDSPEIGMELLDKSKDIITPVVTTAQLLKNNGFDVDFDTSKLPGALKWAVETENIDVVQHLLAMKPEISAQNGYGDLLGSIIRTENEELLGLMMEYQVDMNIVDKNGWTALFFAAALGYQKMMEMLLSPSSGATINLKDNGGRTPLHFAAINGNKEFTKMLIRSGADVNALDDEGETPLHKAASFGYKDNTKLLLNAGADIEANNEEGLTALRLAFECGFDDVVRLLLQRGANTRSVYVVPFTPKHPETSKEGFEAALQAIKWWEEENTRKNQLAMAVARMDQSSRGSSDEPPRKIPRKDVQD